jgi:hypothetical protein
MASIPYFFEFILIVFSGVLLMNWSFQEMGLFASLLACLSPSLVIPTMLKFHQDGLGFTPKIMMMAAPLEIVFAIINFNVFSNIVSTGTSSLYPWVATLPSYANILLIPINLILSCTLGYY